MLEPQRASAQLDTDGLPAGWSWESLENIASAPVLYGILQPGPDTPDGIPYVRPTEITQDVIDLPSIRRTTPTISAKYKRSILRADDIILSIVGTIGKVAVVPPELEGGNITQSSVRIRVRPELSSSRFIAWALRSPVLTQQYDRHRLGTAVPRLNVAHVRALQFPVPPLDEQQRIVAEIEKQFTRLEAGGASLKRVQAALKRYRASVLKAACEGRLVPTEAELARRESRPYEPATTLLARILKERHENWVGRGKYKEPAALKDSVARLPEGWTSASVEQTGQIETGFTPPKANAENYGQDVPFVKPPELRDCTVASAADNLSKLGASNGTTAPRNSILVSCIGNLGKTALATVEVAFNQQINAIIPSLEETARWIFYAVQQLAFREQLEAVASATTISIVNKSKFSSLVIPLPPLAEQHRIVAEVERRLSVIEELEAVVTANLQRATRLRQAILHRAFSGELIEASA